VLELVESRLNRDGIRLSLDIAEDLPPADCVGWKLQQVIMNLLSNARFALNERYPAPDPGKRLRIAAGQAESEDGPVVVITVEDSGSGIHPSLLDDVFDPFFTTKPEGEGTGLGLAISRSIVRDHHGTLVLERPESGGTRVVVTLPAVAEASPAGS
jgi:C4-dicarboxylate-specific signal transduction histidine kinase